MRVQVDPVLYISHFAVYILVQPTSSIPLVNTSLHTIYYFYIWHCSTGSGAPSPEAASSVAVLMVTGLVEGLMVVVVAVVAPVVTMYMLKIKSPIGLLLMPIAADAAARDKPIWHWACFNDVNPVWYSKFSPLRPLQTRQEEISPAHLVKTVERKEILVPGLQAVLQVLHPRHLRPATCN